MADADAVGVLRYGQRRANFPLTHITIANIKTLFNVSEPISLLGENFTHIYISDGWLPVLTAGGVYTVMAQSMEPEALGLMPASAPPPALHLMSAVPQRGVKEVKIIIGQRVDNKIMETDTVIYVKVKDMTYDGVKAAMPFEYGNFELFNSGKQIPRDRTGDYWKTNARKIIAAPPPPPRVIPSAKKRLSTTCIDESADAIYTLTDVVQQLEAKIDNISTKMDSLTTACKRQSTLSNDTEVAKYVAKNTADLLTCTICTDIPRDMDLAYMSCCEQLKMCIGCAERASINRAAQCPLCNMPRMANNLHRVAGFRDLLSQLYEVGLDNRE